MFRAMLVKAARDDRAAVGRDYLIWAQLRMSLSDVMARASSREIGLRPIEQPSDLTRAAQAHVLARDHVAATEAAKEWDGAIAKLQRQPFMLSKDLPAAFIAFHSAPAAMKNLAAAVVAGLALERSVNAPGYHIPLHDTVAALTGLSADEDVRDMWTPTEGLIGMLPKSQQLAIGEPLVEGVTFAGWSRLKVGEITPLVVAALTGSSLALRQSMRTIALRWVHPLLSFRPDRRADAAAELQEAAE
jgi:ParB family chromosome partitioning protein